MREYHVLEQYSLLLADAELLTQIIYKSDALHDVAEHLPLERISRRHSVLIRQDLIELLDIVNRNPG